MSAGELTARVARRLSQTLEGQGLEVLFDHGDRDLDRADRLGRIASWFGPGYARAAELAMVDIAVVEQETGEVRVLIEVEEGSDNPKTILGDALGTLLGEHITFQGKRDLRVGPATTLVILARDKARRHAERAAFLQRQLAALKPLLSTPNAAIGRIVLDTFEDEADLEARLMREVERAFSAASGWQAP